jgi:ATP-dependent helicase/DNAse subunit B
MTATVHILCGPAGSGKTQRLMERYRSVCRQALGAALWLGPTQRNIEALRPRLFAGLSGCLAPNVFTFQDFAEEIIRGNDPSARPLSHVQRRLLADDLLAELHAQGQLSHFHDVIDTRGFAETVFHLLGELKQNEIRPELLSAAVADHARDRQGALIYAEYQKRLLLQHFFDLEGRLWYARDLFDQGMRRPFSTVRAVFVAGFTSFTRTQHDLLEILCRWVDELWITLPDEEGEERAELFSPARATRERLLQLGPVVEDLAVSAGRAGGVSPLFSGSQQGADAPRSPQTIPAGLAHLERQLFRPPKTIVRSENAEGLYCIEAPGLVGETRLVARQVKSLLLQGTCPDDVLVTMRDVLPYADLVREVFPEYGIPIDVEGTEALLRNPAVATLLRTLRLPDEDWPFAAVTALLRSGYFRPDWPETRSDPELAQHSEALLRLLEEPRGREAYLKAVQRWAENPPPGLEDEQAEESRRRKKHELARKCRGFLTRFFHAWDGAPLRGTLAEHTAWLHRLADDLGLARVARAEERDAVALQRLWDELEQWVRIEQQLHGANRLVERGAFHRLLGALTSEVGLARTPRGPGRVRVLSAPLVRGLKAPFVFVMGLGERSFPRLAAPELLFDEQQRQALKQAGLDFPCAGDLLPEEMLLFYQVVTRARRLLVLSYPAVDDKGQELLPSSFLVALKECFQPEAIPTQSRRMLIEGYDREEPLCPAEERVQWALRDWRAGGVSPLLGTRQQGAHAPRSPGSEIGLPFELEANLLAAAELARHRFHAREHTPYDGLLSAPAVLGELQGMFGPDRILSPTALESYIACPFRFFLDNVLHLEPLAEPREDIESTDRGLAFHRALARLHAHLRQQGIHGPTEEVNAHLWQRLAEAVEESASRANPAAEVLWRLEGERLQRMGARYRAHWQKFVEPWLPREVLPRPEFFEVSFGLPGREGEVVVGPLVIRVEGLEVRISGRIDRVDLAELADGGVGYWIIDYKTGRASHYTGSDLKEFRRLQLTLYALAVQEVLLADKQARPLGLAYWLVTETGPKVALPAWPAKPVAWFDETAAWRKVREQLQRWVVTLVTNIRQGQFALKPRSEDCTRTCDYAQVCRISQSRAAVERKTWQLPLPTLPERGGEEE